MGKKEERSHADEFQAQDVMHGRSHLISPVVSDVHAYQKMIQEQILHENKCHDKTSPSLPESTSIHERLNNGLNGSPLRATFWTMDVCMLENMMKPMMMMPLMTLPPMMPMMMQVFHSSVKIPSVAILYKEKEMSPRGGPRMGVETQNRKEET